jgi:hypothetical protein
MPRLKGFALIEEALEAHRSDGPGAVSVPMESDRALDSRFDAFSQREPVSTSLENALKLAWY